MVCRAIAYILSGKTEIGDNLFFVQPKDWTPNLDWLIGPGAGEASFLQSFEISEKPYLCIPGIGHLGRLKEKA